MPVFDDHRPNPEDAEEYEEYEERDPRTVKRILTAVLCGVLVLAVGVVAFLWWFSQDDGRIYDNVSALGVNLSGMTEEEAIKALSDKEGSVYSQPLVIQLHDRELSLDPQDTKVDVDVTSIVHAALSYGRGGNMFERARARSQAALTSFELDSADYLQVDTAYIRSAVDELVSGVESTLAQPTITLQGQMPDLSKYLLAEEVKEKKYDDSDYDGEDTSLPEGTIVIDPETDDLTVENGIVMTIMSGTPGIHIDANELYNRVLQAYNTGNMEPIEVEYEEVQPDVLNAAEIFNNYCVAPVDSVLDEEEYVASLETLGYGFDPGALQSLINGRDGSEPLEVSFQLLIPTATKAGLEGTLFQDVLSNITTDHTYNNNRTVNLILACEAIDGYIVKPGAQFSFNDVVGERTAAKGYREAAVYSGTKTVQELGGGVCQIATTLYMCTLYADLQVDERAVHTFMVSYCDEGLDATVYFGSLDYRFTNNTEYPIMIKARVHDGIVDISFIGTETKDYYIKMRTEVLSRTPAETVKVVVTDGSYKDGQTIQTAYDGATANSYKQKWDRETDTMISEEFEAYSSYAKRDRQVAVVPSYTPDDSDE